MTKQAWLYLITEFGPLVAFFIAGQVTSFFNAVAILMVATLLSVVLSLILTHHVPWLPVFSAVVVLLGGHITLIYEAPDAIIFADTVYYASMALILGGGLLCGKNILQILFSRVFAITDAGWYILALRWLTLIILAAVANEVARYMLTPEQWINYRLLKSVFITLFAIWQIRLSIHYRLPGASNRWGLRIR